MRPMAPGRVNGELARVLATETNLAAVIGCGIPLPHPFNQQPSENWDAIP